MTNLDEASKAIRAVFSDTSVSPETTLDRLETLRDEVNEYIEAVETTIEAMKGADEERLFGRLTFATTQPVLGLASAWRPRPWASSATCGLRSCGV
jgi:hypothetical protein